MSEVQSASLFSVSGYALGDDPAAALAGLCAADSLFHAVFKNTPVEVFYLDRQGVVRFAEGLGARTWAGQEISALFPENPQLTAALAQVWQGTSADARLTLEPFYFDAHFEPVADQTGKIEGALVTAINITEGYQYRRSLEESEQRFKTLYEHASVGVMIQALDGSLQDCNPAIQEMLNLGAGKSPGAISSASSWRRNAPRCARRMNGWRAVKSMQSTWMCASSRRAGSRCGAGCARRWCATAMITRLISPA